MVVDDNPASRYATRRILNAGGYATDEAASGRDALAQAAAADLVILDINLPDLSGFEVCRRLRADPATGSTPVIHISAAAVTTRDVVSGLDGGADAYFVHPVEPAVLLATVGTLLRARSAERRLRRSERRFRAVVERADTGIVLLDDDWALVEVNPHFARLLGQPQAVLQGQPLGALLADDGGARLAEIDAARARDEPWAGVLSLRGSGGRAIETEWRFSSGWESGTRLATVTDVSERHAMERVRELLLERERSALADSERARSEAERANEGLELRVWERTADLIEANTRLEAEIRERERAEAQLRQSQKMEAVGRLTGGIAHDFNNLLTAMTGNLELLRRRLGTDADPRSGRYLEAALDATGRAASLTHRLLAFSRQQVLAPKAVDPLALAISMQDMLERTLGESVRLVIDPAVVPHSVLCDANQLENVLLNLVINARDAMPEGGTIRISCSDAPTPGGAGGQVRLDVADTGTGIAPEVVDKIFEPFFTTKPSGQGTGLGLSMVYGFAAQSGGHVAVQSELGRGSTFSLWLPRADEAGPLPARATAVVPPSARGERLLLLEDNGSVRPVLAEALRQLGYAVVEAADGEEALRLLDESADIDLVVSDIGLPGADGREIVARARERRPDLPVLFVTGYAQPTAGAAPDTPPNASILSKPVRLETLAVAVRDMLDRQPD
nr:response regulator [Coralloluteibacterium stylophorae]